MDTGTGKSYIIMTNRPKDPSLAVTERIRAFLEKRGARVSVFADNEDASRLGLAEEPGKMADGPAEPGKRTDTDGPAEPGKPADADRTAPHAAASCMIVLGGDGTMLKAAKETAFSRIPLLGVNLGTMGYLAEVEVASLEEALERLLRGDYTVEERMMLSGSVRRGDGSRETAQLDALNDVTVTRCGPMQVVPLRIWVNGQLLAGYGADGIVIATPTGSTGYNLSAGGPIVEPEAGLILLTPICPHTLNTRSVVLCDRDEVEVEIGRKPSGDVQEVEVSFDGALLTRLRSGDRVRVKKSERTTSIIRLSEPAFLERLHRKMSE
ncbi:MAG TPA: NAD(+)/NADH kinase [Candidatus Eisenbergiella pullistercoris]|uniref:NAD kinase n=1 Tax=Candidatus Eisenbergiella pullistercoris TaxID=2838555 RepID=A0A9D2C5X1_9FIRM|nr:NAD(+)/NADH kinase [Candidatus Eisenbergiella pullistercoris]